MKRRRTNVAKSGSKPERGKTVKAVPTTSESEVPLPNAFLEDAKKEPKRKLLSDHIETINLLRNEKRFTFRAIADWLTARGIETDHSAVYRTYLAAIPEDKRDPDADWSDVDEPE